MLETEDETSISHHMKVIAAESKKKSPDWAVLTDKMERTAAYRANFITTHAIKDILASFPPLHNMEQMTLEATRNNITPQMLHSFVTCRKEKLLDRARKVKSQNLAVKRRYDAFAEVTAHDGIPTFAYNIGNYWLPFNAVHLQIPMLHSPPCSYVPVCTKTFPLSLEIHARHYSQ